MLLNFDVVCRLCMADDKTLIPLYDNTLGDIPKKIRSFAPDIEIYAGDELPSRVCTECTLKVDMFAHFKQQCEKSDVELRKYLALEKNSSSHEGQNLQLSWEQEYISSEQQQQPVPVTSDEEKPSSPVEAQCSEPTPPSDSSPAQRSPVERGSPASVLDPSWEYVETDASSDVASNSIEEEPEKERKRKVYMCEECGSEFSRREIFMVHMRQAHSGVQYYTCEECGKTFTQNSALTRHSRVHTTGDKPFTCSVCGKYLGDNASLTKHMRVHTGIDISTSPDFKRFDFTLHHPVHESSVGQTYSVMVSHIEHPGEFYVHIVCRENAEIDNMNQEMTSYYNRMQLNLNSKSDAKSIIGSYCAAYFADDDTWCRGEILDWNEGSDDSILVKYVDYGNQALVTLSSIQPLRRKFTVLPICAQQCYLGNVIPQIATSERILSDWSEESVNLFKCLVDFNVVYIMRIIDGYQNNTNSLSVVLEDMRDGCLTVINDSIVEFGYAEYFNLLEEDESSQTMLSETISGSFDICLQEQEVPDITSRTETEFSVPSLPNQSSNHLETLRDSDKAALSDQWNSPLSPKQTSNHMETLRDSDEAALLDQWNDPSLPKQRSNHLGTLNDSDEKALLDQSNGPSLPKQTSDHLETSEDSEEEAILDQWDPMTEDYYSETNNIYHDDEDAAYIVSGYKAQDERRVCRFYAEKGFCYKGETCQKEHTFLHPEGWTTDQEEVYYKAFNQLTLPEEGSEITLNITQFDKANTFYGIIVSNPDEEENTINEETIVTLNNYINDARNVKTLKKVYVMPGFGQVILARYTDDRFYRARVVDFVEDDILVTFVDYGNQRKVGLSDIRAIEGKYLHLPFQAVQFVIANVESIPGDHEGAEFLQRIVGGEEYILAKVVKSFSLISSMEVLLVDSAGNDIGEKIIAYGRGLRRDFRVLNKHSEIIAG